MNTLKVHLTPKQTALGIARSNLIQEYASEFGGHDGLNVEHDGLNFEIPGNSKEERELRKAALLELVSPKTRVVNDSNTYMRFFLPKYVSSVLFTPTETAFLQTVSARARAAPVNPDGSIILSFDSYATAKAVLDWVTESAGPGNQRQRLIRMRFQPKANRNAGMRRRLTEALQIDENRAFPSSAMLNAQIRELGAAQGAPYGRFGKGQARASKKNKTSKLIRAAQEINPTARFPLKLKSNRKTRRSRTRRNRK